eukprot:8163121-Pyramimonas_sp.AAC.1
MGAFARDIRTMLSRRATFSLETSEQCVEVVQCVFAGDTVHQLYSASLFCKPQLYTRLSPHNISNDQAQRSNIRNTTKHLR